jgi:hypothetical protein
MLLDTSGVAQLKRATKRPIKDHKDHNQSQ